MNVYKTVLYVSLEKPLNTVVICNPHIENELYRGPFEQIPETLFNREVTARLYEYTVKTMKLWVRA
jgi:hypothetical protein